VQENKTAAVKRDCGTQTKLEQKKKRGEAGVGRGTARKPEETGEVGSVETDR